MLKIQNIIRAGNLRYKTKNPVQMPGFLIKNFGASKGARTLDLNLGKVAL